MSIRFGSDADLLFVADLGGQAFSEYSTNASASSVSLMSGGTLFVAVEGERNVGFVIVSVEGDKSEVRAIAVVESFRGRGLGERLLRTACAHAKRRGAAEISLTTADSNLAALSLFLRSGFERAEHRNRYYARGQDALRMMKVL